MTREQRRRNLEAALREIETRIALTERKIIEYGSSSPPEFAHDLAALESERDEAQRQLAAIDGGDQQTQAYRRAVDQLSQWFGTLQQRIYRIEQQLTADAAGRHERQDVLDAALDDIRTLVRDSATERRAQLEWMRLLIIWLGLGQLILFTVLALLFWRLWPLMELWR